MNIIKDWFIPKTNNKSYSELSDTFKLKENMSDDDLVYMSHKRSYDDTYETVIVSMKEIKNYLISEINKLMINHNKGDNND